MSRVFLGALTIALLAGAGISARQAPSQSPTPQPTKPSPSAEPSAQRPEPTGQPVNIKLDLTIIDQLGPGEPSKKIVTMLVADRGNGYIRSTGYANVTPNVRINVDASPSIVQGGSIRLRLGLEYNPRVADANAVAASLNEQVTVMLEPGKPVVVSQSADPVSDRRITVEVRGTIMK
jgi:hypothetical protein